MNAPRVGIVGGGQLARMTAQAAVSLGVGVRLLADHADDSAAQVVADTVLGDYRDLPTLLDFAAGLDVITFDHEHVPLAHLEALHRLGVGVHPGAHALRHAQDKAVLRRTLAGVAPQPRFAVLPAGPADQVAGSITAALADFAAATGASRLVLKTIRGGYDGKGVWVLPVPAPADVLDAVLRSPVRVPGERAGTRTAAEVGLLVEEFVPFVQELAAQVARSPSGQAAAYPVVATRQRDGVCAEVIAPAPVPEAVALQAQRIALDLAGRLGVVGLLAVELFQTDDGQVLVNELAMRPHNSGHWTIDGAVTSQFEQHLRAVLDLPLGATTARDRWTVMANILGGAGPDARDLHAGLPHVMAHDPGARVHLYGKSVVPGRKVGHVTVGGADLDDVLARARHAAGWLAGERPA